MSGKANKKQNANQRPKSGGTKKSSASSKKKNPAKKGWDYAKLTKVSVAFNQEARQMSELLLQTYGDGVSITLFEKMIADLPQMKEEMKSLIYLNDELIDGLERYRASRDARDTQRDSFHSDISVANVEGGMEAARAALRNDA